MEAIILASVLAVFALAVGTAAAAGRPYDD